MALKANRVGVNPKMVDELGNIKKCEGDYLTVEDIVDSKTSTATNKALSANQGKVIWDNFFNRLRANSKDFKVVYISDLDKYGYQMGTDTPIPFNSGSSATLGINVLEPVTTDISTYGDTEILEGGYQIDAVNNVVYINMKIKISGDKTQGASLLGLYSAIQPKQIKLLLPTNKVTYNEQEIRANSNLTDGEEITITGVAY